MREFVDTVISWGPAGILILAALDSAGIPIPAAVDALLMLLSARDPAQAVLCCCLAVIGSVGGSLFLFWISRKGGEAYLERHTVGPRGLKLRTWFQHYGLLTVFISAVSPLPLPMKLFVICSGALGVPTHHFLMTVTAARIPRYAALAYLGSQLGTGAAAYLRAHVWQIGGILALLLLVLFGAVKSMDARRARLNSIERS